MSWIRKEKSKCRLESVSITLFQKVWKIKCENCMPWCMADQSGRVVRMHVGTSKITARIPDQQRVSKVNVFSRLEDDFFQAYNWVYGPSSSIRCSWDGRDAATTKDGTCLSGEWKVSEAKATHSAQEKEWKGWPTGDVLWPIDLNPSGCDPFLSCVKESGMIALLSTQCSLWSNLHFLFAQQVIRMCKIVCLRIWVMLKLYL